MTPREKFNQQVWEILQEIEEELLATEKGKPVKYRLGHFVGAGIIPKERKQQIIYKLQELGALRVRENPFEPPSSTNDVFYLDIIQSKFDNVYKMYQIACDLNHYLNDYQQRLYKGEKRLPEFSKLDDKAKLRIENAYKKFATTYQQSKVENTQLPSNGTPYCMVEKGWGYLKFGKHGKKKEISKANSRPFLLLQATLAHLGVFRTTEMVFEAIRKPKDNNDSHLSNWSTAATRKVTIIKNTIKELQKNNKLDGKIRFEFDDAKTQIRAVLLS